MAGALALSCTPMTFTLWRCKDMLFTARAVPASKSSATCWDNESCPFQDAVEAFPSRRLLALR